MTIQERVDNGQFPNFEELNRLMIDITKHQCKTGCVVSEDVMCAAIEIHYTIQKENNMCDWENGGVYSAMLFAKIKHNLKIIMEIFQ